jgi:hypothetical protein
VADGSAQSAAASATLQLSKAPKYLFTSIAKEQLVPSQSLLPLPGLPQSFLQALEPVAQYWKAVGMSLGTAWPDCMEHYDETFSPLISMADDLMNILTESTSACTLSLEMLQLLRDDIRLATSDSTCQANPSQVLRTQSPQTCMFTLDNLYSSTTGRTVHRKSRLWITCACARHPRSSLNRSERNHAGWRAGHSTLC